MESLATTPTSPNLPAAAAVLRGKAPAQETAFDQVFLNMVIAQGTAVTGLAQQPSDKLSASAPGAPAKEQQPVAALPGSLPVVNSPASLLEAAQTSVAAVAPKVAAAKNIEPAAKRAGSRNEKDPTGKSTPDAALPPSSSSEEHGTAVAAAVAVPLPGVSSAVDIGKPAAPFTTTPAAAAPNASPLEAVNQNASSKDNASKNPASADAFALRVRPVDQRQEASAPTDAPAQFAEALATIKKGLEEPKPLSTVSAVSGLSTGSSAHNAEAAAVPSAWVAQQPSTVGASNAPLSAANQPSAPADQPPAPVRSVQIKLTGEGNTRVDLHMVERDGALSVNVRSSDPALTRGLQDQLPDLTARLSAERYHAEAWLPTSAPTQNSADTGQQNSPGRDQGFGQGRQSSGGGDQSQGGQGQRQSRQFDWSEELQTKS